MTWRSIKDDPPPMDGTMVDLWCRRSWNPPVTHERRTGVYFCQTHKRWRTEGNLHFIENTFDPWGESARYLIPEFWMPLPEPPDA